LRWLAAGCSLHVRPQCVGAHRDTVRSNRFSGLLTAKMF
jgi:hypothetical protein